MRIRLGLIPLLFLAACRGATPDAATSLPPGQAPTSTAAATSTAPAPISSTTTRETTTTAPPVVSGLEEFPVPAGSHPHDVAPAGDGTVWYTAQRAGRLGRLDPASGRVEEFPLGAGS
ncbi:MAG: hypothetical protein ACRD02_00005, partial [Acidimicrobiia bacterium]